MLKTKLIILAVLFITALTACETAVPPTIEEEPEIISPFLSVPYSLTPDGLYQIDVMINRTSSYAFIIDTGATISVLFESTARQLDLEQANGRTTTIHGIIASAERPIIVLDSLSVGSLERKNLKVATLEDRADNPSVAGILGLDFLSDYALIFDHKRMELDFTTSKQFLASKYQRWNFIRLNPNPYAEQSFGLQFMYITISGYRTPTLLDLGSSFSVLNWAAAQNRQLRTYKARLRSQWEIEGAVDEFRPKLTARFRRLFAGEHTWYSKNVLILDLETLNIIGVEDKPLMIAGMDLFKNTTIAIDFEGQRLYVKPNSEFKRRQAEDSEVTGTRIPGRDGIAGTVSIPIIEGEIRGDKVETEDENGN